MYAYKSLDFKSVKVKDPVFSSRVALALGPMLKAVTKKTEETGRIDAFDLKWKEEEPFKPHVFWDSDVAKVLEGMAYILALAPDPELEKLYESWVDRVVSAQQPDGYLNTYFTTVEPGKRFSQLNWAHELYCAGHLIEAAVAGFEALGKRKFLDAMCRYADLLESTFGMEKGKRRGWPGHEELELALIRLYKVTGERRYLCLASYFVEDRGSAPNVFTEEGTAINLSSIQAEVPFRKQMDLHGHAVRAVYFCAGAADVARETEDEELLTVCRRMLDNIIDKRSYITGGIGSTPIGEAITADWDLPESTAYAESCAAIGLAFFCSRMVNCTLEPRYAEMLERVLYNNCMSGVGNSGDTFFYANPIQMLNEKNNSPVLNSGQKGVRQEWYDCSCCPTNYIRFLPRIGSFFWSADEKSAVLHIPAACEIDTPQFGAVVSGTYPAGGKVTITMTKASACELSLRIPLWAQKFSLKAKGEEFECQQGYVKLSGPWKEGDKIELDLEIKAHLVFPHGNIASSAGRAAIMRGPLVYALESCDNPQGVHNCRIRADVSFAETALPGDLGTLLPAVVCEAEFRNTEPGEPLYSSKMPLWNKGNLFAIPYYLWQNRGASDMRIFIPFY